MYGRWLITADDKYPDSARQLRLAIHTGDHAALLYSASDISIPSDTELQQHPYISRLGPDLLDPDVESEQLAARLSEKQYRRRCLMGLLLLHADKRYHVREIARLTDTVAGNIKRLCAPCHALNLSQNPAQSLDTLYFRGP